jgi:hypothetical protein
MGLVDLQVQLDVAMPNLQNEGHGDRAEAFTRNMLDPETVLPQGYDIIWMSQFLDCFSDDEIIAILKKCHVALPDHGTVFVNETFWNEQRFDAGALCLQMTSLYFTAMANGNSQMYDSDVFKGLIAQAGFVVAKQHDNIGLGHTILELKKA